VAPRDQWPRRRHRDGARAHRARHQTTTEDRIRSYAPPGIRCRSCGEVRSGGGARARATVNARAASPSIAATAEVWPISAAPVRERP
jgi:hypothetical protein